MTVVLISAICAEANATPSVTGVSGAVRQGATLTASGSGFGTNVLGQEWTGANIEAGAVGALFSKAGWSDAGSWSAVKYADDAAHSGAKSLKVVVDPGTNWNGLMTHSLADPVNPSDKFYVSWWARYIGGTNGQWKMLRLSGENTVVDGPQEMVLFNWFGSNQLVIDPGTGNDQSLYPPSAVFTAQGGAWYREELIVAASSAGSANGSAQFNRYGGGAFNTYTTPPVKTHVSSGNAYRYVLFQNYFGNGITGAPTAWLDDIYIANTWARVELCDGPAWSSRTRCEVQAPTAWSDASIAFTANAGSFPNGAAYLYVVDAAGTVNQNGFAVTIGSGDAKPPATPRGLRTL